MRASYYNEDEFNYANSLMSTNPVEAKTRFEEYLLKYPNDYSARIYYAYVLIVLRMLDEASLVIDKTEEDAFSDKKFNNPKMQRKIIILNEKITLAKIKLLFYQGKYQELYFNYFKNDSILNSSDYLEILSSFGIDRFNYDSVRFYIMKNIGLLSPELKFQSYLYSQILDYSDDRFFEHVKKHVADDAAFRDTSINSLFKSDFNLEEIINEVKKYIPSEKGLYFGILQDVYIFKYDNCGYCDNQLVNYFEIVCFHNTCDFITIHPIINAEHLPCTDLNYMRYRGQENNNPKIRRRSQIDKFNKRFNIN